jgi:hypothetical protein
MIVPGWVRTLAESHVHSGEPCLGTLARIDADAVRRGAACVREGRPTSIGRTVEAGESVRAQDARPCFEIETHVGGDGVVIGSDRIAVDTHGLVNTHLDGLAHIGVDGCWHGGVPAASIHSDDGSLMAWARHGIMTRAVFLDIPEVRGEPWVRIDRPVSGDELEAARRAAGVPIERGDALVIYSGRDRYENAGHRLRPIDRSPEGRPGLGEDAARWLADHEISVLCWDFLEAHGACCTPLSIHFLIWAIGLALIDNCASERLLDAFRQGAQRTGMLTVGPLLVPRATGVLVNPFVIV